MRAIAWGANLDDGGVDLRAWQGLARMYPGFGPLIEGTYKKNLNKLRKKLDRF